MADCKNVTPQVCGVHLLKFPSVSCADAPHFEGITNITVNQGDDIDLTDGVHAYDGNGFEIPYQVIPDTIDPCASGQFTVKYTAVGSGKGMRPTFPDCVDTANHLPCEGAETEVTAYRTVTIRSIGQPTINIESDAAVCDAVTCEDSVSCPKSVSVNDLFDPLEGVVARDGLGRVLPVTFSGEGYFVSGNEIYYPTAGSYTLTYTAEDACGNRVTATVGIEVKGESGVIILDTIEDPLQQWPLETILAKRTNVSEWREIGVDIIAGHATAVANGTFTDYDGNEHTVTNAPLYFDEAYGCLDDATAFDAGGGAIFGIGSALFGTDESLIMVENDDCEPAVSGHLEIAWTRIQG